jgi:thiosulfate reductase cytochrome b subunit
MMAPDLVIQTSTRHSALVRVTHWINAASFFALVVSGIAILIAHPRLYWGETGSLLTPSLFDLPIPLTLGQSGWGRYLHFLAAWICVLNGLLYAIAGLLNRHFENDLFLARGAQAYNIRQKIAYLAVVFGLFPLIIVTGLAMSPAVTSVVPALVEVFGGQQSARTLHFFLACCIILFFFAHVAMVTVAGFLQQVRAMITGQVTVKEPS